MNNKVTVFVLIAIIILGVAILLARSIQFGQPVSPTPIQPNPTPTSTAIIKAPFLEAGGGQRLDRMSQPTYINTSTGAAISFRNGRAEYRTAAVDLYLNDKKIGGASGDTVWVFGFAPDNKYFAFESELSFGCCTSKFEIQVVNLMNATNTIRFIDPPHKENDYSGPKDKPTEAINPFIEPYKWDGDSLQIMFYYLGLSGDYKNYRVSSKEIWRYDLTTKQYTLLETLPEPTSTVGGGSQ